VAVRAGFTCNSCRFLAPLDSLDADGAVECAHCGLRQRFDNDNWAIEPAIWWMLLGGVSAKRSELLTEHAQKSRATHKNALALLKGATGSKKKIGDAPGVYEAPEVSGWNLAQMLFTVALGMLALLIAFGITRLVGVSF
jgi:hypothetical protein